MTTGAIIALILSALASAGAGIAGYINTKKTNEANKQQYEDWKAYNSPSSQMERLGQAGLNPYMVNNVNNTLSSPFQFGQNSGIAEALQGASQSLAGSANLATDASIKRESNAIRKDNVEIAKDKLELEKEFTELRKQQYRIAIKKGDAQAALFWSSADNKDLVNNYLKRTMPFRVGSSFYDYLSKQQDYSFNELYNPLKLNFYAPYMRSVINKNNAQTAHLSFMENFAQQQFLFDQEMRRRNFILNKNLGYDRLNAQINNDFLRLQLSNNYYDLAFNKWLFGLGADAFKMATGGKLLKATKGGAGMFPSWTEYEYGF